MVGWKVSMWATVCGSLPPGSAWAKMVWIETIGSTAKLET